MAIPVSYFMPEIMYFAAMTAVVWVALWVSDKDKWWLWSLVGASLGIAALVKPHAIFMLPAVAIFAAVVSYKKAPPGLISGFKSGASAILGFVVLKFGLGFLFAGVEGFKLFGGYGSPIDALTSAATNQEPSVALAEGSTATGLELLVTVSVGHLLMHLAAVLLIAGLPLLLSLRVMLAVVKKPEPIGPVSSLFVLVGLITFSMIAVVAVFEAYVTAGGDDHSDRLILRYYEFLIPQFLIMGLLLPRFTDSKRLYRILQGGLVVAGSMFFTVYYPITFDKQYADSSTLPGIGDGQGFFIFVGLFVSSAVIFWIVNPEKGNIFMGRFVIPGFLILALIMSQNKLIEINGTKAYFDQAGWDSRTFLQDVPGDEILVVGQTRTEVFTVKFWIDQANIKDLLILEESVLGAADVEGSNYVVALGNIGVGFPHEVITQGDGYQLVKVSR
jgi:phosphoglycerol transferase